MLITLKFYFETSWSSLLLNWTWKVLISVLRSCLSWRVGSYYFLPFSRILSSILQSFISKVVEDTEHHHGGQGLTWLSKQGICPKHHGRERRAVQGGKKGGSSFKDKLWFSLISFYLSSITCVCTSAGPCRWCRPEANQKDWRTPGLKPCTR